MQNGPAYPAAYPTPLPSMGTGAPGPVGASTSGSVTMNPHAGPSKAPAASAPIGYVPPPVQSYPGGYYGPQGSYNPMQYAPPPPMGPYGPSVPQSGYYPPYYNYPPQPNSYGNQANQYYNHGMMMPYQTGPAPYHTMPPPVSQHQINANVPPKPMPSAHVSTTAPLKTASGPIQHKSIIVPEVKDRMTAANTAPEVQKTASTEDKPEFPQSLKDYITRAFRQCSSISHRTTVGEALRDLIQEAQTSGTIHSKDWDTLPLPSVQPANEKPTNENSSLTKDQTDTISGQSHTKFSLGKGQRKKRKFSQTPWPTESGANASEPNNDNNTKSSKSFSSQDSHLGIQYQSKNNSSSFPAKRKGFNSRKYRPRQRVIHQSPASVETADVSNFPAVKGTSQELEKGYLRLTEAPDPASVRPESVLKKSIAYIMTKFRENSDYYYISDQLKSIRQDLTVQCIQNEFTVEVYEMHARLSIRYEDMNEYNQCQTQLAALYKKGHRRNFAEFLAYRIIYVAIYNESSSVTCEVLQSIGRDVARDERIVHALNVRKSIVSRNYVNFFRYMRCAPSEEARCLMSLYIETCRFDAVKCICIAYQTLAVSVVSKVLDFSLDVEDAEDDGDALVACVKWLESHGAVFTQDSKDVLDCRKSSGRLHVPEREDAVAHGDENISFANFLSSK